MNKSLFLLAGLSLIATNAMASKARLQSLGQASNGSAYVKDLRNIYYNAANVTKAEFVAFEFGGSGAALASTAPSPNAEGGFVRKLGTVDFGLTLGRRSTRFDSIVTNANNQFLITPLVVGNNSTEVLVGGHGSVTWGAGLLVVQAEDKQGTASAATPDKTSSSIELRGGVMKDNWEAYAELYPSAKAETTGGGTTQTAEGKFGAKLGGSVELAQGTAYADLKFDGSKWNNTGNSVDREKDDLMLNAGFAQTQKVADGVSFLWAGGVTMDNQKTKVKNISNADVTSNRFYLPLVIGLEAMASDWLTLRGSVAQRVLLDKHENGTGSTASDSHAANTTTVAAGAGLQWKKLTMDGTLAGATGSTATGNVSGTELLANASLSYLF